MSTQVYHIDQNIILVQIEDLPKSQELLKPKSVVVRKLNKEKLKIILQISGCKPSQSFSLSERIFDQIFSKLLENLDQPINMNESKKPLNLEPIPESQILQDQQKQQSSSTLSIGLKNSVTVTEKYFKEFVMSAVAENKHMKDKIESYVEDFTIAWSLTEKRDPLIVLLGGTSGTGKSTVSSILASKFGISTVLSTDSIRHIMRNFMTKDQNPLLFASTYEAGKFIQVDQDEQMSDFRRVIKGYKIQCQLVQEKLEYVIDKFERNNDAIIIEGVHLTPFFMLKIMKKYRRVLPFALCIIKESKHKERFAVRSKYMTLDSRNNKYVENFPNIRLIQKWFLEKVFLTQIDHFKADEYLIPKVDNSNVDKSIELIHKTIIQYLKKAYLIDQQSEQQTEIAELKNAHPFYEEYNKVNKNAWSSKELKDYIHSQVNKSEIYENFLQQMNEAQKDLNMKDIDIDKMQSNAQNAKTNYAKSENESISVVSNQLQGNKLGPKELIQQSVQKFNEISKNEKPQQAENTEANYIVEYENDKGEIINHLSDQEEQNEERRRRNQDDNETKLIVKKVKSLKNIAPQKDKEEEQKQQENIKDQEFQEKVHLSPAQPKKLQYQAQQGTEPEFEELQKEKLVIEPPTKHQQNEQNNDDFQLNKQFEDESTPQKIDYKGILQHLSKHKRMFLSKKTKPESLTFINKMMENYNKNYKSNDRIRLIQNNDGSYCLFKINVSVARQKRTQKQSKEVIEESKDPEDSSSEHEESVSELASLSLWPGKSLIGTSNFPLSEKREQSDGDSVRYQEEQESDNEPYEGDNDIANSIDASSSSDDENLKYKFKQIIEEDEDSFELQRNQEEQQQQPEEQQTQLLQMHPINEIN